MMTISLSLRPAENNRSAAGDKTSPAVLTFVHFFLASRTHWLLVASPLSDRFLVVQTKALAMPRGTRFDHQTVVAFGAFLVNRLLTACKGGF
jgi:hypothetical protein